MGSRKRVRVRGWRWRGAAGESAEGRRGDGGVGGRPSGTGEGGDGDGGVSHPDSQLYILIMCISQAGIEKVLGLPLPGRYIRQAFTGMDHL